MTMYTMHIKVNGSVVEETYINWSRHEVSFRFYEPALSFFKPEESTIESKVREK